MAAKKGPPNINDAEMPVEMELLSADQKKAIRDEAHRALLAEMEQDARDKFYADELKKLRREKLPAERYITITIDSAPYVPYFMIDGVRFYNGYVYEVPVKQAAVLSEQMQRSWLHQDEIDGRSKFAPYRREQGMKIGLAQAGTTTRGFAAGQAITADSVADPA
jgi:hypothetical protein